MPFFFQVKYDKKFKYTSDIPTLRQNQQSFDNSVPMKYLTNLETSTPQPTLKTFLSPSKQINSSSSNKQIHISPPKPLKCEGDKDRIIVEDNLTRLKFVEKRASKPKILSLPATRDDVEALGKWLDSMISALANEKTLSLQVLFENLQLVYLGCFQELIRQVSIECFERGQLIHRIWNAYINLFERAIIEQSKGMSTIEIDYLKENARLHRMYQKELERIRGELSKITKEKKDIDIEVAKLKENFKYAKKKNVQLEKDTLFFKTNYENMRTEYNLISEDNISLKSVIEKNMQQDRKNEDVEYVLRRLPKRAQKIGALVYDRGGIKPAKEQQLNSENPEMDEESEKNTSFYIEEKGVDTVGLLILEDKCVDTSDLNEKKGGSFIEIIENKVDKMCESSSRISESAIMGMSRDFPRLSGMMIQEETPGDLKEEIQRCLRLIALTQEEMQDLKIAMQEKENTIEKLVDRQGTKEQELALLSQEV